MHRLFYFPYYPQFVTSLTTNAPSNFTSLGALRRFSAGQGNLTTKGLLLLGKPFPRYVLVLGIPPYPSPRRSGMPRHISPCASLLKQQRGGFTGPLSPRRRAGKRLTAFPCNLGVSLSRGLCEQAATRKDFQRRCSRSRPLPRSAESALTIVLDHTIYPGVCFCLSALYAADCSRFLTVFELVTDDKREKNLLKKNGTILNHIASFLSLQHSRAGSA